MENKYAYTKTHHFNYMFENDKMMDSDLKYRLKTLFKLFDNEFKKTLLIYDLKNFISYSYLLKKLMIFNENIEFTKTPILIKTDFGQDELINFTLLSKCVLNSFSKAQINEYLFNMTCEKLGWYKLI